MSPIACSLAALLTLQAAPAGPSECPLTDNRCKAERFVQRAATATSSAVRAAQQMQRRLARYNEQLATQGITLRAGIGIHAGEVIAGYLGTQARLEYTVIGHNVNLAARLEGKARAPLPSLLFSQAVADRVAKVLPIQPAGEVSLKGVTATMQVFTLPQTEV